MKFKYFNYWRPTLDFSFGEQKHIGIRATWYWKPKGIFSILPDGTLTRSWLCFYYNRPMIEEEWIDI